MTFHLELAGVVYLHRLQNCRSSMGERAGRSSFLARYGQMLRPMVLGTAALYSIHILFRLACPAEVSYNEKLFLGWSDYTFFH